MRQEQLAQRHAAIDKIADGLRVLGKSEPLGLRTALPQAVRRALQRSQHVITITDGVPTCTPTAAISPVPTDGHLLFLLVPPGGAGAADRANMLLDRLTALERAFRGSRALLARCHLHGLASYLGRTMEPTNSFPARYRSLSEPMVQGLVQLWMIAAVMDSFR